MEHDLSERRRALENAYFIKHDRELIARAREERELLEASGVEDRPLLRHLIELGITVDTLEAMAMVPLLFVAWADGQVDKAERAEIIDEAKRIGLEQGSAAYAVLEGWMHEAPNRALLETWSDYMGEVAAALPGQVRVALREEVMRGSRAVANASGGFLRMGNRVSPAEQSTLDHIEAAFGPE